MSKLHNLLFNKITFAFLVAILSTRAISETLQLGDLAPRGAPDGQLNAADSLLLQRMILGDIVPTNDEMLLGNVAPLGNVDGVLNAGDLVVQQRAVLGQITLGTIETDTTPPAIINLEAFSIDTATVGQLTLTGLAGAVEAGATLNITNNTLGQNYTVVVDSAGAFSITIAGLSGNTLLITVEDSANNTSDTSQYVVGAIQILTPNDTDAINDDAVNVYGTFIGPANTGVSVNGVTACVKGNEFYINNVNLINGASNISAVLTYQDGTTSSHVIQVTGSINSYIATSVSNNCSVAPSGILFNVELPTAPVISTADSNSDGVSDSYYGTQAKLFEIDYDGDGTVDESSIFYISGALQYTFSLPGIYESIIRVTDELDVVHTEKVYVVVQDNIQQDSIFQAVWDGMWTALRAGDKATAMQYLTQEGGRVYGGIFDSLMPYMNETFDELSVIEKVELNTDVTDYAVIRLENGVIKTFMINFDRGSDGVWRIDSM